MGATFEAGDQVIRPATGEVGVVRRAFPTGMVEVVVASGGRLLLDSSELELVRDDPIEALLGGELGMATPYGLRLQSLYLRHAYRHDPLAGLSNARIEPAPHQIYVAHRVVSKLRPRMVLADEVGLGKTIEAGLILKELRARELVERVLVVVPASLQQQWQQELRSKFNEEFDIIDGPSARFLGRGGANPWQRRDRVICSITLASHPKYADRIIEAGWDLVIFDEAHRVRRRPEGAGRFRSTRAYELADELKELTYGLLLLTATPMQLHPYELYSLVELVEPGIYPSFDDYEIRRRELPRLNQLMRNLLRWAVLDAPTRQRVLEEVTRLSDTDSNDILDLDDVEGRRRVMDRLVSLHPLADALVRNRKAEVGGFTRREPTSILVPLSPEEESLYEDVSEYIRRGYNRARSEKRYAVGFLMVLYQQMLASSSTAIRRSFLRRIEKLKVQAAEIRADRAGAAQPAPLHLEELREAEEATLSLEELERLAVDEAEVEAEIVELEALVRRLGKTRDSKARELLKAVGVITRANRSEKILVFTRYIETQEFLRRALEANGYETVAFNGSMTLDEKEAAVLAFRGPAQIMVTTEAGGEGRNFQFAHFMFNYDLPWNPMRVEQRIGRLDRIGQKKPVFIYNLACENTVEERILEVLDQRIGLFRESVGSLDPILGEVERDIERLVLGQSGHFDQAFEEFAESLGARVSEARDAERVLADFILDHASFRRDRTNDLLARSPMATSEDLQRHLAESLGFNGGRLDEHPDGGSVISLAPKLATRLRQRQPTHRGVFDPKLALEREDLPFLAIGHELVDSLVDLPQAGIPVLTGRRCVDGLPAGPIIEVYYEIETVSMVRSGHFVHHLVDADALVVERDVRTMPPIGLDCFDLEVPAWAPVAFEASRRHLDRRVEQLRVQVGEEHRRLQEAEIGRAARIYEYRSVRLRRVIDDEEAWIADAEAHGTERQRRILPARRGKLEKNRARLVGLEAEHHRQVDEIRARKSDVAVKVLAAGVVSGS